MAGGYSLALSVFGLLKSLHQLYKNKQKKQTELFFQHKYTKLLNIQMICKVICVDYPAIAASGLHPHSCVISRACKPNHSRAVGKSELKSSHYVNNMRLRVANEEFSTRKQHFLCCKFNIGEITREHAVIRIHFV